MRSAAPSARAWSHHRHRRGEPGGDRRAACPGARDPAPGRISEAAAAALSAGLARLASAGRATIFEARRQGDLLASGMLVVEGDRSFYLFSGSRREEKGEPKRYASYALQMAMMRHARAVGAKVHDLGYRARWRRAGPSVVRGRPLQEGLRWAAGGLGRHLGHRGRPHPVPHARIADGWRARPAARSPACDRRTDEPAAQLPLGH